jgi:hypothetical protein
MIETELSPDLSDFCPSDGLVVDALECSIDGCYSVCVTMSYNALTFMDPKCSNIITLVYFTCLVVVLELL